MSASTPRGSERTPFTADSPSLIFLRHLTDEVPDPRIHRPEISEGLVKVILKMMQREREDRYQDMTAVDKDLERVQRGQEPLLGGTAPPSSLTTAATLAAPAIRATESTQRSASAFSPGEKTSGLDPLLKTYEIELARFVGPMAKVLVRRTAKTAASLDDLAKKLALELANDADRAAFLAAVKKNGGS